MCIQGDLRRGWEKEAVGSNDLGCEEGEKVEKMGKEGGFSRFVGDD